MGFGMALPERIPPALVRRKLESAVKPILVCAYEDEGRCSRMKIPGSLTLREFEERLPLMPWAQEIIFYCDSPGQSVALRRAQQYQAKGYPLVGILDGGIQAWERWEDEQARGMTG